MKKTRASIDSRLPGFYKLSMDKRLRVLARATGLKAKEIETALGSGGLSGEAAEKIVENVLGTFALPFALAVNFTVNGRDYLVPMVVEEPSVVAAAGNAARMVREGGGFSAEADESLMIGQVQLDGVGDIRAARRAILARGEEILAAGNRAVPELCQFGGGVREIQVRELGEGSMVVHLLVDCRDAMGANMVNTVCESVSGRITELAGARSGLRILSNLCDRRLVRVTARVPAEALAGKGYTGPQVCEAVERASRFAERDIYRAATHNKGLMNGADAVVVATGNDWRAVEAGAHAFAARDGRYRPLCTWRADQQGRLCGRLEMPLALGIVGGSARAHQGARLALEILGVNSARELGMVVASVGMASNLAALRALATEGIQAGHMTLHARSVAIAAGAVGEQAEAVAQRMCAEHRVTLEAAGEILGEMTRRPTGKKKKTDR
jgi:hydroxymethylglutaryl-CoA reductase